MVAVVALQARVTFPVLTAARAGTGQVRWPELGLVSRAPSVRRCVTVREMKSAKETLLCALAYPGAAKDPGQEAYMTRILACESPDAKMEVYGKPLGGSHFASASASRNAR